MEEGLAEIVFFVILTVLCKSSDQNPLCKPDTVDCRGNWDPDTRFPGFSSKYRALEYDQTAMKLLMEMLLKQHNALADEYSGDSHELTSSIEWSPTKSDENELLTQNKSSTLNNFTPFQKKHLAPNMLLGGFVSNTGQTIPNNLNAVDYFSYLHHQIKPKTGADALQGKVFSPTLDELKSSDQPEQQLPSIVDRNQNRFNATSIVHPKRITVKPGIELGIRNSGKLVAAVTTQPTTVAADSKKMISSKYKDNRRTPTLNEGPHILGLHSRPMDGFTEPLAASSPLSIAKHREHFKGVPTTKLEQKISSLQPIDRGQDIRGEIQLETLNRPINTEKPITTPPTGSVGCADATSCTTNNNKIISAIKVKMGQQPMKVVVKTETTTKKGGLVGKPGIRFPNSNAVAAPSSAPSKVDDNLISTLAAIVDSDENNDADEEDSHEEEEEEDEDEVEEYYDEHENENGIDYIGESVAEKPKNVVLSKDSIEVDEDDEDNASSDVISSVIDQLNALI